MISLVKIGKMNNGGSDGRHGRAVGYGDPHSLYSLISNGKSTFHILVSYKKSTIKNC